MHRHFILVTINRALKLSLLVGLGCLRMVPGPALAGDADALIAAINASIAAESASDYVTALARMDEARKLGPNDYFVHLRCGWVQYLNGRHEEARGSYHNALEISHGQSVEALLGLTYPQAALADWDGVERSYIRVLELDPRNFEANLRLGQIYLNRADYNRAEGFLKLARDLYPGSYEANLSSAWNAYWKGNHGFARECFERALMMSQSDTSATRGLELLK